MPLAMFAASVPAFIRGLGVLSSLLRIAAEHAQATGVDPAALIDARLASDMLSLAGQVQHACDTAKLSAERLSGVAAPRFPDTERTFAALQVRISATVTYLESIDSERMHGAEQRTVQVRWDDFEASYTGESYLLTFALPNFYFHVAMAHGILRHGAAPIGKLDYLGRPGAVVTLP